MRVSGLVDGTLDSLDYYKSRTLYPCDSGATDYLYPKGSMSMQAEKNWHDDANGPSTCTCWQSLGEVQGHKLYMIVCISGCRIRIPGPFGKVVHFQAWLPHKTELVPSAHDVHTSPDPSLVCALKPRPLLTMCTQPPQPLCHVHVNPDPSLATCTLTLIPPSPRAR